LFKQIQSNDKTAYKSFEILGKEATRKVQGDEGVSEEKKKKRKKKSKKKRRQVWSNQNRQHTISIQSSGIDSSRTINKVTTDPIHGSGNRGMRGAIHGGPRGGRKRG
jgi:hypothetical protein